MKFARLLAFAAAFSLTEAFSIPAQERRLQKRAVPTSAIDSWDDNSAEDILSCADLGTTTGASLTHLAEITGTNSGGGGVATIDLADITADATSSDKKIDKISIVVFGGSGCPAFTADAKVGTTSIAGSWVNGDTGGNKCRFFASSSSATAPADVDITDFLTSAGAFTLTAGPTASATDNTCDYRAQVRFTYRKPYTEDALEEIEENDSALLTCDTIDDVADDSTAVQTNFVKAVGDNTDLAIVDIAADATSGYTITGLSYKVKAVGADCVAFNVKAYRGTTAITGLGESATISSNEGCAEHTAADGEIATPINIATESFKVQIETATDDTNCEYYGHFVYELAPPYVEEALTDVTENPEELLTCENIATTADEESAVVLNLVKLTGADETLTIVDIAADSTQGAKISNVAYTVSATGSACQDFTVKAYRDDTEIAEWKQEVSAEDECATFEGFEPEDNEDPVDPVDTEKEAFSLKLKADDDDTDCEYLVQVQYTFAPSYSEEALTSIEQPYPLEAVATCDEIEDLAADENANVHNFVQVDGQEGSSAKATKLVNIAKDAESNLQIQSMSYTISVAGDNCPDFAASVSFNGEEVTDLAPTDDITECDTFESADLDTPLALKDGGLTLTVTPKEADEGCVYTAHVVYGLLPHFVEAPLADLDVSDTEVVACTDLLSTATDYDTKAHNLVYAQGTEEAQDLVALEVDDTDGIEIESFSYVLKSLGLDCPDYDVVVKVDGVENKDLTANSGDDATDDGCIEGEYKGTVINTKASNLTVTVDPSDDDSSCVYVMHLVYTAKEKQEDKGGNGGGSGGQDNKDTGKDDDKDKNDAAGIASSVVMAGAMAILAMA